MIEDGSSFKQLAQKLSDGRHEVVGLFVDESGGTWFERNGKMVVALGVTIMLCSYFYFSKKDQVVEGMDDKEEKGNEVMCVEDAWDTEKHNIMK